MTAVDRMIRVGIATREFMLCRICAHERGIRIFRRVGGLSALIEVIGNEFAFALHATLMCGIFDFVETWEDERSSFRHFDLAIGFPGGAANFVKGLADFIGGRVYFVEDGLRDVNLGVISIFFRLVSEDKAVKTAGPEEFLIHLGEEVIVALVFLHFHGGHNSDVDDCASDHAGNGGDATDDHGGDVDDSEDGGCFSGLVHAFQELEEGGLVDAGVFENGGIGANKAAAFRVWTTLGNDHCGGERHRVEVRMERVLCHEGGDDFVNIVLLSLFAGGYGAELILRKSIE